MVNEEWVDIKLVRILYIIHTLFYILARFIDPVFMCASMLRCFWIPLIATVVLTIWYFVMIRKEVDSSDEFFLIVMLIINVLNLMALERNFQGLMGI